METTMRSLTRDQRTRLRAAVRRHQDALDRFVAALDDPAARRERASDALAAEVALSRLLDALGLPGVPTGLLD